MISLLMLHQEQDGERRWVVTHMATSYQVKRRLSLKEAKELISRIKDYPIFLMPTIETWNLQMEIMKKKNRRNGIS